jgi:hypothetical protein
MGTTPKLSKAGKIVLGVFVLLGIFAAKTYWWDTRPEVIAEKEAKAKQDSLSNLSKDNSTIQPITPESVQTTTVVTPKENSQVIEPVKTTKKTETSKVVKELPKKTDTKKTSPKKSGERENLDFNNF